MQGFQGEQDLSHNPPPKRLTPEELEAQRLQEIATERRKRNWDLARLCICLLVFFIGDFLYREMIFEFTIPHLKILEGNRTIFLTKISAFVSQLGDYFGFMFVIGSCYHVMGAQSAFIMQLSLQTAVCVYGLLKSYKHEARPFFVADLTPTKCWVEYGSPSGHSICSTSLYFTMWYLLCQKFKPNAFWYYTSLVATCLVLVAIAISRLYNGVHTYNQILLGWLLGFSIYYLYCHILFKEINDYVSTTRKRSWAALLFNTGTFFFCVFYLLAVLNFVYGNDFHPVPQEWYDKISQNCPNAKNMELDVEKDNFKRFNHTLSMIGAYLGLIIESKYMPSRDLSNFCQTPWYITLSRLIFTTVVGSPTIISMFLFPKGKYNWVITMCCRELIPMNAGAFYLFGLAKFVALKGGLINT